MRCSADPGLVAFGGSQQDLSSLGGEGAFGGSHQQLNRLANLEHTQSGSSNDVHELGRMAGAPTGSNQGGSFLSPNGRAALAA